MITHKIEIEETRPVKAAPQRMHPQVKVALEENIDWMLESGVEILLRHEGSEQGRKEGFICTAEN